MSRALQHCVTWGVVELEGQIILQGWSMGSKWPNSASRNMQTIPKTERNLILWVLANDPANISESLNSLLIERFYFVRWIDKSLSREQSVALKMNFGWTKGFEVVAFFLLLSLKKRWKRSRRFSAGDIALNLPKNGHCSWDVMQSVNESSIRLFNLLVEFLLSNLN